MGRDGPGVSGCLCTQPAAFRFQAEEAWYPWFWSLHATLHKALKLPREWAHWKHLTCAWAEHRGIGHLEGVADSGQCGVGVAEMVEGGRRPEMSLV